MVGLVLILLLSIVAGTVYAGEWILTDKGFKVWNSMPQPHETVTWSGSVDAEGYAIGKGTLQWFQSGKSEGTYKGNMLLGKETGKGVCTWANGDRYEGNYLNGERNGIGLFTWHNGGSYEGHFVNGIIKGQGTMIYKDGFYYYGKCFEGVRNGYGTLYSSKGTEIYKGMWFDNIPLINPFNMMGYGLAAVPKFWLSIIAMICGIAIVGILWFFIRKCVSAKD